MSAQFSQKNRGFTLVELLVVITIIGVLASLAAGGAMYVRGIVINTTIKSQLSQMEIALEAYKNEFNEYPPMLSDRDAVMRHVNSRWRRASLSYADVLTAAGLPLDDPDNDGPAEREQKKNQRIAASLTFWLGGLYVNESYAGFNADLENPLVQGTQWTETRFDFGERYLLPIAGTNAMSFAVDKKPVVYFRSSVSGDYDPAGCDMGEFGVAVPYAKNATAWHGAKKYQLIHPGRDGLFGDRSPNPTAPVFTSDENGITYEDYDNIVNFTDTATLRGALNQ
ncbi:MAG: type II secretion system GspH family protein [Planctomycetaceae bacterium]|nr:type II secretion system GspH family protein [Planctomycetaceae bacterium]